MFDRIVKFLCCLSGKRIAMDELLGRELVMKNGSRVPTLDVLEGKIVLLFFGAHW